MSVRLEGDIIVLEGDCFIEDAETLTSLLQSPSRQVDVSQCRVLHTALLQAMLAFRPDIIGHMQDETMGAVITGSLGRG